MIQRIAFALLLSALLLPISGCSSAGTAGQTLKASVAGFNKSLRWKKFNGAASFLPAAERSEFLKHYLGLEKDLFIQSLEIRSVQFQDSSRNSKPEQTSQQAQVLVMAEYYILPSTVVKRRPVMQSWELRNGNWQMIKSNFDFSHRN
tara:strand:+ start:130 stop:570 length:441 start_codon:yes stop_codon:yes gene_type:complete